MENTKEPAKARTTTQEVKPFVVVISHNDPAAWTEQERWELWREKVLHAAE